MYYFFYNFFWGVASINIFQRYDYKTSLEKSLKMLDLMKPFSTVDEYGLLKKQVFQRMTGQLTYIVFFISSVLFIFPNTEKYNDYLVMIPFILTNVFFLFANIFVSNFEKKNL